MASPRCYLVVVNIAILLYHYFVVLVTTAVHTLLQKL
jgi:hypothetical protein